MRLVVLLSVLTFAVSAAPMYSVVHLGNAGGISATAFDISNGGYVAGSAVNRQLDSFGVAWTGPDVRNLGRHASADAVNSSGAVAGSSLVSGRSRATVWENGAARLLGGGTQSYGTGINDAGDVVGAVETNGRGSAFVESGGSMTLIDTPGWWSSAYDISNTGQVVGTFAVGSIFQAFSWTADGGLRSLGTLGGGSSYAQAVNDAGVVVGGSFTRAGRLHAFLYDGFGMRDLGTLGGALSSAYGVNASGHAVGYSLDEQQRQRAFVWRDGVLFDLNSLIQPDGEWTLESAYGINDSGQIVGVAFNGVTRSAFLLNPMAGDSDNAFDPAPAPVPEPGTSLLLVGAGAALALLGAVRRRSAVRTDESQASRL